MSAVDLTAFGRCTRREAWPGLTTTAMDQPPRSCNHCAHADEAPRIDRLHQFIDEAGCRRVGKHHETYLTDPRSSAPARNRTIIRQPIAEHP
jgi:hypothetical protein